MADNDLLKPLAGVDGDPVFDEAWQAQALAIADTLVQNGLFGAVEWSRTLGEKLAAAEADGQPDNQETYYRCVLASIETLVAAHSDIDSAAMQGKRQDWEKAYLSTPHGQPVRLDDEKD